jgi:O-antigen/teichoic acid export membrane protein
VLLILFITTVCFFLAPVIADTIWHKPEVTSLIRIALPISILATLSAVPDVYFQSLRKFHISAAAGIGRALISLLGIGALALVGAWTPTGVIVVSMVSVATGSAIFVACVPRSALITRDDFSAFWPPHFKAVIRCPIEPHEEPAMDLHVDRPDQFAKYLMISSLLVMVTLRLDHWMLGTFRSAADIGLYSIGTQLAMPLNIVLTALTTSLFPRMARSHSHQDLLSLLRRAVKLCGCGFIGAAAYSIVVPQMAPFILGESYRPSVFIGHILCVRSALSILACPLAVIGYGFGFAKQYMAVNAVQVLVVLTINVLFVAQHGPLIPALALLANEIVGALAIAVLIFKHSSQPR